MSSTAGVSISRKQAVEELMGWASEEMGVKAPSLKGDYVDGLRGLVATKDIRANDEMVTVPSDSALITTTDQRCPFPDWVDSKFWDSAPWNARLALLLLRETRQGRESRFYSWVESLPRSFQTPLEWSTADVSELQYPHLEAEVARQRGEWEGLYASLTASSPGCGVTDTDFTWAMGVVSSRAFSGPYEGRSPKDRLLELAFIALLAGGTVGVGLASAQDVLNGALTVIVGIPLRDFLVSKLADLKRYALTPVIDLINHKAGIESDVAFNYFYGYFSVTTQKAWKTGEQVFISYGARTNDLLLQRYGFVEPDNPNDVYCITGLVDKLSSLLGSESVEVLRGKGKARGGEKVDSVTLGRLGLAGEEEEARVMPIVRLAVVRDDQLPESKAGNISLEDFAREVSPANERAARSALLQLCVKEREGFATTLGEDESTESSFGPSYGANKRLALGFRIEKKRVLDAAIQALAEAVSVGAGESVATGPAAVPA